MTRPLHSLPITQIAPLIFCREVAAAAVVEACLGEIERRGRELNAFTLVAADAAREAAREADREIAAGRYRGPLHGVPVSIKDLIDQRGLPTTAASRVMAGHTAAKDARCVAALRDAGAVLIGKCNLHEFAYGPTSEDSCFGPPRNPHDPSRTPGGSSGGSAAAVAAGMCAASIGTDTGGSIRNPAAACGVVGLKPAAGELSCDGVIPLSRTLDSIGPITRSVGDAWIVYRAMAGDPSPSPLEATSQEGSGANVRLGVPRRHLLESLDPGVRARFEEALGRLRAAGFAAEDVEIPHAPAAAAVYLHIVLPEASEYHARRLEARPEDYTPPVRLRLEMGRAILAEDYVRAMRGREVLRREVDEALSGRDALVLPTLPIPAPILGAATVDVGGSIEPTRAALLRLTQIFNLSGSPAISIPCGKTEGLPCGLQIVGHRGRTKELMSLALAIERLLEAGGGA